MEGTAYSASNDQLLQGQQMQQQQPQQQASSTSFTIFVWKFFSVISWLLLIFTSLEAYFHGTMLFSIHRKLRNNNDDYYPLSVNLGILQSFYLVLLLWAFYHFAYLGLYKGDNSITNPYFEKITNYHFVPLFLVSFINIIGQVVKDGPSITKIEGELIADLVFTILALAILVFIYIKTLLVHEWYIVLTLKKGLFYCLIILLWHNFFYLIVLVGYANISNNDGDLEVFLKGSGIAGAILFGLGGCAFSFFYKDIIAAATTLLLYIGMVVSFYGPNGKSALIILSTGTADGVIEIIWMFGCFVNLFLLIYKYSADCGKS